MTIATAWGTSAGKGFGLAAISDPPGDAVAPLGREHQAAQGRRERPWCIPWARLRTRRCAVWSRSRGLRASPGGSLNFHDLSFLVLQQVVDLLRVVVGELLYALLGATLVVRADLG